jgi:glutathione S-transferase
MMYVVLVAGPFSHRALLALEEKKIPYSKTFVDLDNKPQWLLDINPAGSVPIIKDLATGEWTVDSGVIVDMLEKKFPEPSYGTVEGSPQVGLPIFGAFKEFAKAETEEEAKEKEAALVSALEELDTYLQKTNPYIGGDSPCSTDLLIMPRLYHLKIALKHFRVGIFLFLPTTIINYSCRYFCRIGRFQVT